MILAPITPAFLIAPKEAATIARILAGYGELEFEMAQCLARACGGLGHALRLMFKPMLTEKQRINVVFENVEPLAKKLKLAGPSGEARKAIHWCRDARNTFAHCHWAVNGPGELFYISLGEFARDQNPRAQFSPCLITPSLLDEIEGYYRYTARCLAFLCWEADRQSR